MQDFWYDANDLRNEHEGYYYDLLNDYGYYID